MALASLGILFFSVLLHELGHVLAALKQGGDAEEITLGPLGGLTPPRPPQEPLAECLVHLACPAVNLVICLISGGVLWAADPSSVSGLLNPLTPQGLTEGVPWKVGLKLTCWINWVLLVVNLLPAFPFDGGRALRTGLSVAWPDASPRRAAWAVGLVAKVAAAALLVVALLVRQHAVDQPVPLWFALVILAIFLYFGAKQEEDRADDGEREDEVFGYDFSQGYTSLERSVERRHDRPGLITRWLEQRREARQRRQRELEEEEERRADEILGALHEKGMDSLSEEERLLLKRVSARYRQRNSKPS
jgi:Zn-dependent protease